MQLLYLIPFLLLGFVEAQSQCCLQIQGRTCISCPTGTHLYRGNCIIDIPNCQTYKDGFDCQSCLSGFALNSAGECEQIPVPVTPTIPTTPVPEYTDVLVDVKSPSAAYAEYFDITVDYFKAFKTQLANSNPTGANVRTYKNGTIQSTVEFQDNKTLIYYKGVLQPNLTTYILKEISFGSISKPTLVAPTNGTQNNPATNPNTTTSTNSTTVKNTTNTTTSNTNTGTPTYSSFDPLATNDQNYLIVKDFLSSQSSLYASVNPTKAQLASNNNPLFYYKLTFNLADGSVRQVILTINLNTYITKIQKQTILTQPTKTTTPTLSYVKVQNSQISNDLMFLICVQYINKQNNNKYVNANIRSLEKMDDKNNNIIKYRVYYEQGGYVWEVIIQINSNTFVVGNYTETRKEALANNNTSTNTNTSTSTTTNTTKTNTTTANTTNTNTNTNTGSIAIPPNVLALASGLTQLSAQDLAGNEFVQIDSLLRQVNPAELTGAKIVAAYVNVVSFTKNYQIYYQPVNGFNIYEAKLARDSLRNKNYIISFTRI